MGDNGNGLTLGHDSPFLAGGKNTNNTLRFIRVANMVKNFNEKMKLFLNYRNHKALR
jgi:hypothetical protein